FSMPKSPAKPHLKPFCAVDPEVPAEIHGGRHQRPNPQWKRRSGHGDPVNMPIFAAYMAF
ncbi:hypothetical protein OW715_01225, partial [Acidithiobacillus ferriphilus]|uniref:hypothetical protein n=1 Tax=Acidithiobacillus ferriphilus TaxID=1689834 RepID=UPI002DC03EFE